MELYEVTADQTRASAVITSFADLYRDQYGPTVRLAHLLPTSNSVAEELVQDTFVRVHRKWDQIDAPRAYLRTAVLNACRSHRRRRLLEKARNANRHAVEELLSGPLGRTGKDTARTLLPLDARIGSLSIEDGVARLDLTDAADAGGGSCLQGGRREQARRTLLGLPGVHQAEVTAGGRPNDESFQP